MNITFIIDTFIKALYGVPVTLGIMVVAILLSFLPALFLALGQIYKVRGVKTFSNCLSCVYSCNTSNSFNFILL